MLIREIEQSKTKYYTYNDFCIIENDITTEEEREKYSRTSRMEYISTAQVVRDLENLNPNKQ